MLDRLPPPHHATPVDIAIGLGCIALATVVLVSPPSPTWKLVRAGVVAPIAITGLLYCGILVLQKDWEETWGTTIFVTFWTMRIAELLIFFPAEENTYRLKLPSRSSTYTENALKVQSGGQHALDSNDVPLIAERVPPPWTMEKLWWSSALFWSFRGIGWNFTCQLPPTSLSTPYSHTSTRRQYLSKRLRYYLIAILAQDISRTFMNLSSAHPFFAGLPGRPAYTDLSQWQRAIYSIAIAVRIWFSLEKTHVLFGLIFVAIGGMTGWKGEFWEPWGWPPMFGGLRDIWHRPGLSFMWSRVGQLLIVM
jgi:hypothetical protein